MIHTRIQLTAFTARQTTAGRRRTAEDIEAALAAIPGLVITSLEITPVRPAVGTVLVDPAVPGSSWTVTDWGLRDNDGDSDWDWESVDENGGLGTLVVQS